MHMLSRTSCGACTAANAAASIDPALALCVLSKLWLIMAGVCVVTAKKWSKDLDCLGEWLRYDQLSGCVTRVYCELCTTHADSLRALRNFSPLFSNGITGGALKKDNVVKHSKFDISLLSCELFIESVRSHVVMLIINELLLHQS